MTADQWGTLGAVVLVALVIYVGSLWVHPWQNCPRCKGTGKHRGALFTYSRRPCRACNGDARQLRLGRRLFWPVKGDE